VNILVVGGTKFAGIHLVKELLQAGHSVTIATRGKNPDPFGEKVNRIILERTSEDGIAASLLGKSYDVVYDSQAYSSNEVKYLLNAVACKKYIAVSTVSVYAPGFTTCLKESDFDPLAHPLKWCDRNDFPYDEVKRQMECAIFQAYGQIPSIAVRLPLIIGEDDYTMRLYFYIRHIVKSLPMYVDNPDTTMEFIMSHDAGKFMAWLADVDFCGGINAANCGKASLRSIIDYVESKSGVKAIISPEGEAAPLNGFPDYGVDLTVAKKLGYKFPEIIPQLHNLLDKYICDAKKEE